MKLAIVGATGMVGRTMVKVLEERNFSIDTFIPVASKRSKGEIIECAGHSVPCIDIEEALKLEIDIALFSAGGSVSKEYAPKFSAKGVFVIDNSSAFRMDEDVPLVVPEINMNSVEESHRIIANPNCSTIQMVLALSDAHSKYGLDRIVISTYQSVSGTGKGALDQLMGERKDENTPKVYPHEIDLNCIPHCDIFLEDGYTKEERKLLNETRKIFGDNTIRVTATAVRVPVYGGHSESINASFQNSLTTEQLRESIRSVSGVTILDDIQSNTYPTPKLAFGKDDVFVGRIRKDHTQEKTFNLWVVSDNLRKGAATNAVQIAEQLIKRI